MKERLEQEKRVDDGKQRDQGYGGGYWISEDQEDIILMPVK